MTPAEVAALLTFIARLDNRNFNDDTVDGWHDVLAAVPATLADAIDAARDHFRESPTYITPHHIVERIRIIRSRKIEKAGVLPPTSTPAALQVLLKMTGDGLALPKNLLTPANETPGIEGERLKTLHTMRNTRYSVPCPWPPCHASIGDPCRNAAGMTLTNPHPSRADLARETHHDA